MLNERERLIFHLCTAMVMSVENKSENKFDMKKIEDIVTRNRARHLTKEEIKSVKDDMTEEILAGTTLYEEMIDVLKGHKLPWSDEDLR